MRFLVDESCDVSVTHALAASGHDIKTVLSVARGADDDVVLELASSDQRILLTEDKDFGELVFAAGEPAVGVILIRYPFEARQSLPHAVVDFVHERRTEIPGAFVVMEPSRFRITRLP